jgi:PAS domain S-box-containing protein
LTPVLSPARRDSTLEERSLMLIEAVVDYGIFVLDPQGYVVSWNTGAERLKGYSREEIIGQHFSVFYPPEAVASGWPEEELRRASTQGRFEDEGWRLRKDGSRFWANVIISAIHDASGELVGFAKVTRDLTERRQHEEELRVSEERFRLLVENVRDYAIFMLDVDGTVRSWNAGAQALKGYTASEIIGRHFSVFYTPQDQVDGKPAAELRAAKANGRVEDEGWRVRKDGTVFWANVVITTIYGRSGELIGFAKVTRDLTEHHRLEQLERSSRRMSEFLAMLAHELRNPLAPIRNAVTVMQLETLTSPALRNCRDIIDRQLTHMTRLVDDLLDAGRLTTGKIKLRKERVRVAEVVSRSVETARPLIEARHHTLSIELPEQPVYVDGDSTRLSQIVQNLLINAAKYTPDGGHIVVKVAASGGFAAIAVSDNGRGISAVDLENIFNLFMQGENGRPDESGLGIGLTLARSLAELHGGTIEAQSPGPGQGSTFVLRLPAVEVAPSEGMTQTHPGARPEGRRVMVVDDNRDSADTTTAILRLLGHQVECAYSGQSALDLARHFLPAVVLLDLAMPGMSGFETLRRMRAQPGTEQVFAVAMTGFGGGEDKLRSEAAGFDAHVTKPVDLSALVALLNEQSRRHSPQ